MVNLILDIALPKGGGWFPFLEQWFLDLVNSTYGWFFSYALAIVLTTLFIKLIMIPLSVWQKYSQKKMSLGQKKLAPELAKIQKQYAYDKNLLQQKQNELYTRKGMNPLGNCLSMVLNMALSMIILFNMFGAINKMTAYKINQQFEQLNIVYEQTIYNVQEERLELIEVLDEDDGVTVIGYIIDWSVIDDDYLVTVEINGTPTDISLKKYASDKAKEAYDNTDNHLKESFLWIRNIWRKDDPFSSVIPSFDEAAMTDSSKTYFKTSLGLDDEGLKARYNDVFKSLKDADENQGPNGYYVLAVIAGALAYLSMFLMKKLNGGTNMDPMTGGGLAGAGADSQQKKASKITQFIMPAVMAVFTLLNSATFAIYMISSYAISTLLNLGEMPLANLLVKLSDKINENKKDKPGKPKKQIKGKARTIGGMDVNNYKRPIL